MTPARRSTCSFACALIVVASAGCEAPGNPRLAALSSPGGTYEVHLTGRVTRARIFENRVRAEVFKNGAPHLPARLIFAAGLFDTAFNERFGSPEWAASNVLRFPGRAGAAPGTEPDSLTVRNVSDQPFPSIRIETARDMFLVFDSGAPRRDDAADDRAGEGRLAELVRRDRGLGQSGRAPARARHVHEQVECASAVHLRGERVRQWCGSGRNDRPYETAGPVGEETTLAAVGLVGGLGPESTIDYYRRILEAWQRHDPASAPSLVIDSLDAARALRLVAADREALIEYLFESLQRLAGAGVDFAAMTANTAHIVFDELAARSSVPLLSIVEVCAAERCAAA